jgi:hypothetical protein
MRHAHVFALDEAAAFIGLDLISVSSVASPLGEWLFLEFVAIVQISP